MTIGVLAIGDLGSNSFKLEITQVRDGHPVILETLKETVSLGEGLSGSKKLSREAIRRGWSCLAKFGDRLRGFDPNNVRVVATQTLRESENKNEFLETGQALLGFPIQIITGEEEASLTFSGVHEIYPHATERRLVFDIGGASTELVVGVNGIPKDIVSEMLGSVTWTKKFFRDGRLTFGRFEKAVLAAEEIFTKDVKRFGPGCWDRVYGSSGTVSALSLIVKKLGLEKDGRISDVALQSVYESCIAAESVESLNLAGLKNGRRKILPGGLSVLIGLMRAYSIDRIVPVSGAMRFGVMHQLIEDQEQSEKIRDNAIRQLQIQYEVDISQANRVKRVATHLLTKLSLHDRLATESLLSAASAIHEIGGVIAPINLHKHSPYLLEHIYLQGFDFESKAKLLGLLKAQMGKLKRIHPWNLDPDFQQALISLRLSLILCCARTSPNIKQISLTADGTQYRLVVAPSWIERNPHLAWLLKREGEYWERMGITFNLTIKV